MPGRSLYELFQESDVYFLSTTSGRPQGVGGKRANLMWTGASKLGFSCGRHKWMTP